MGLWWHEEPLEVGISQVGCSLIQFSQRGTINWIGALRQARQMAAGGIDSAVVTLSIDRAGQSRQLVTQLQRLIVQHGIDLEVRFAVGFEMNSDLFEQVTHSSLVSDPINRRYVFLQITPGSFLPVAPVVESLKAMGLRTVLMSAENSLSLRQRPSERQRIEKSGAIIQFSSQSLLGDPGDPGKAKFCKQAIRSGGCHLIGQASPASQPPSGNDTASTTAQAVKLVKRLAGKQAARELFRDNARRWFFDQPASKAA